MILINLKIFLSYIKYMSFMNDLKTWSIKY